MKLSIPLSLFELRYEDLASSPLATLRSLHLFGGTLPLLPEGRLRREVEEHTNAGQDLVRQKGRVFSTYR